MTTPRSEDDPAQPFRRDVPERHAPSEAKTQPTGKPAPPPLEVDEEAAAQRERLADAMARLVLSAYRARHPRPAVPDPPPGRGVGPAA